MIDAILTMENVTIQSAGRTLLKNINLHVNKQEIVGIVGESGSGKSLTVTSILNKLPSSLKMTSGSIHFLNRSFHNVDKELKRQQLSTEMAYIFQDYAGSFSPFKTLERQIFDVLNAHSKETNKQKYERIHEALDKVGLKDKKMIRRYPFQLSGGQLQRVAIAVAILFKPKLMIADEPTSALDTINQHTILNLIRSIHQNDQTSVLFISHDIHHVLSIANRIYVMEDGQIVEEMNNEKERVEAKHPYTKQLLQSHLCLQRPNVRATKEAVFL